MDKYGIIAPNPLSFDGNVEHNFKKFKIKFENYLRAIEADMKKDQIKIAILLNIIGDEAMDKYETFNFEGDDQNKYEAVLKAFENYCIPQKKNQSINRHIFFKRVQQDGESIDEFIISLKKLSLNCEFGELKNSLIKDKIISGIHNNNLKDRLLRE